LARDAEKNSAKGSHECFSSDIVLFPLLSLALLEKFIFQSRLVRPGLFLHSPFGISFLMKAELPERFSLLPFLISPLFQ